jgi:hypothetical protein
MAGRKYTPRVGTCVHQTNRRAEGGKKEKVLRRSLAGRTVVCRGGKAPLPNWCSTSHRSANMAGPTAVQSTGIMQ